MKRVYLAHALGKGPGREENRWMAAQWGVWFAQSFNVAISADWIWLSGALSETDENRELGLACDVAHVERCDALWAAGKVFSGGMKIEADHARAHGIPVFDLTGFHIGDFAAVRDVLKKGGWQSV